MRYRCFHVARALAESGHESHYFTRPRALLKRLATLDAIIVVKRLDVALLDVAAAARTRRVPLFLDLCDDLTSPRYARNGGGRNGLIFAALAPALAGVIVPSAAMAERIEERVADLGVRAPRVHVLPDIAETRQINRETARFLGARPLPLLRRVMEGAVRLTRGGVFGARDEDHGARAPTREERAQDGPRRIVWFGNHGSRNSTFGIFSLLPALPVLADLNRTTPLELVVISNSTAMFDALTRESGVPARYVSWSVEAVYAELAAADVALLTTGDDELSTVKSSNRVLQALAAGVPVVTLTGAAVAEFEGLVLTGREALKDNLARCLSADREAVRRALVDPAAPILARYTPDHQAAMLAGIISAARDVASAEGGGATLFVFETADDLGPLAPALEAALQAGVPCEVLVTPQAVVQNVSIRDVLARAGLLPRVCGRADDLDMATLEGIETVVIAGKGSQGGPVAQRMMQLTAVSGRRLVLADALPADWGAADGSPAKAPADTAAAALSSDRAAAVVLDPGRHDDPVEAMLSALCTERPDRFSVVNDPSALSEGGTVVLSHPGLLASVLAHAPAGLGAAKAVVWCDDGPAAEGGAQGLDALRTAHRVVFSSEALRGQWIGAGLDRGRTAVVPGAADPARFAGRARGGGAVGIVANFSERERPDYLRALVRLLPECRFVLTGLGWRQYALLEDMLGAPNFVWRERPVGGDPAAYEGIDVIVSLDRARGTATPLIEAMMLGAVPVASVTGAAVDLIAHGANGFLCDAGAPVSEVAALLERAFTFEGDVRGSVERHDWDALANSLADD